MNKTSCLNLQVKQVMNGVFHSLRGEFDLCESYSGQAILEVILSTIKVHFLQSCAMLTCSIKILKY